MVQEGHRILHVVSLRLYVGMKPVRIAINVLSVSYHHDCRLMFIVLLVT